MKELAIVLMTMLILSCKSVAKECTNLPSNQTTFDVHFWNFYPYTTANLSETRGVFNLVTAKLTRNSMLNFTWGKKSTYKEILDLRSNGQTNQIAMPVLMETDDTNPCSVKVFESTGYAYVVRRNVKKPINQLGASFINGGQVIGLVLILTGIAGICMWLLDRRRNPDNFPAPFITGSWQGFWWAFVTMTTVGYGDLAPKSVPARMFSVLWMLLGLVAFSVLTANFTSSLAREIETDLNLFNKKMAVFKGGIERKAAVDSGGKYKEYNSLSEEMMTALKKEQVEGLLIDKHAAVSNVNVIENDDTIEIGKMIDYKHFVGMRLIMPDVGMCGAVKKCIERQVQSSAFQETMYNALSDLTIATDEVEHTGSLFEDYEFFIILIAIFSVMTGGGVIWEYFWFKPNLMKTMENKPEDIEIERRNLLKYILTDVEVRNLCESCCGTVEAIYQKDGEERKGRLREESKLTPSLRMDNLIHSIPFRRTKDKTGEEVKV